MITANVIHRVFQIRWNGATGTAFTLDISGKQYLITARHVVSGLGSTGTIDFFSNNLWVPFDVHLVGHASGDTDISVLAAMRELTPPELRLLPLDDSTRLVYGQEVFFLGFPFGFLGHYIFGPDGYPMPFVKRALVSLFDGPVFYLDGHNNPGFSGGPVVYRIPQSDELRVAAVISGYKSVQEPVQSGEIATTMTISQNTGIIVSHAIKGAIDIIENNPIGHIVATEEK